MKNDIKNDVRVSTTRQDDARRQAVVSTLIQRELTDDEMASVVGGVLPLPVQGPGKHKVMQ